MSSFNTVASGEILDNKLPSPDQSAFMEVPESVHDRMETYDLIYETMKVELLRALQILFTTLDTSAPGKAAVLCFNETLAERNLVTVAKQLIDLGTDDLEVNVRILEKIRTFIDTIVFSQTCPPTPVAFKNGKHFTSIDDIFIRGCNFLEAVNAFTGYSVNKVALSTTLDHITMYAGLEIFIH